MIGMDRATGQQVSGVDHLAQSIADILSTPIGTRLMRRDYGSALFELVDQPLNALTRLRVFAATAVALARWEPRVRVDRIDLTAGADGHDFCATGLQARDRVFDERPADAAPTAVGRDCQEVDPP